MKKTIKELEDLIIEYGNDLNGVHALKEAITIIKKNNGE